MQRIARVLLLTLIMVGVVGSAGYITYTPQRHHVKDLKNGETAWVDGDAIKSLQTTGLYEPKEPWIDLDAPVYEHKYNNDRHLDVLVVNHWGQYYVYVHATTQLIWFDAKQLPVHRAKVKKFVGNTYD